MAGGPTHPPSLYLTLMRREYRTLILGGGTGPEYAYVADVCCGHCVNASMVAGACACQDLGESY